MPRPEPVMVQYGRWIGLVLHFLECMRDDPQAGDFLRTRARSLLNAHAGILGSDDKRSS